MIETIQQKAAPEVVEAVKAGELSLNAAAVVASLPVEEQQAVAAEGVDGLKQAAKRVPKPRKKPAPKNSRKQPNPAPKQMLQPPLP